MKRYIFLLIFLLALSLSNRVAAQNYVLSHATLQDDEIVAYMYMGFSYALSGDHDKAIPIFEDVIELWEEYLPTEIIQKAKYCNILGNSYINVGRLKDAEELYLGILQELSDNSYENSEEYRILLMALSVFYVNIQNYSKANASINEAQFLFESNLDLGDNYVKCLSTMAIIKLELGDKSFAKMCIDCAVRQARTNFGDGIQIQMIEGMEAFANTAGVQIDVDTLTNNSNIQLKVIPFITFLSNASCVYQKLGYLGDAVQYIKEALRVSEEYNIPNALMYNNIGCLYLYNSRYEESIEYFEKAYSNASNPYEYDEIAFNLAFARYMANNVDAGTFAAEVSRNMRLHIGESFEFMSTEERYNYWKHFEYYLPFLNLIIYDSKDKSHYGDIYDNILKSKGLLLNTSNVIRDAIYASGSVEDIADYEELISLKTSLSNTINPSERENINQHIDVLDKRLTKNATSYAHYRQKTQVDWHSVKDCLNDNDIAIEFYDIPIPHFKDTIENSIFEPRYCAVILRKAYDEPHIIPLCKEDELIKEDLDGSAYDTDSIYLTIWKPLEQELQGVENVYFAADGELHKIAIEYALLPNNIRMNDVYNMFRLSSTRELIDKQNAVEPLNAVLYGGLNYDLGRDELIAESRNSVYHTDLAQRSGDLGNLRYGVSYLPGTKKEVEEIGDAFESAQVKHKKIMGDAGTEESFRSLDKNVNIIHLATHGFFWTEEDVAKRSNVNFLKNNNLQQQEDKALSRSGLIFSGANIGLRGEELPDDVEDGVLTAKELSNMNLGNIDLVVLSACQSGLGETSGEGVFGLQRGFKLAGAKTLLMSLWKVDDTATQMLMTEFYRNLLIGHSKIEALRNAQEYVMSQSGYAKPYYWAGFILLDAIK